MQSSNKRMQLRKKRKRQRRLLILLCALFIILGIVGSVKIYKLIFPEGAIEHFNKTRRVELARELEIPSFIDVQYIHKHTTARTCMELSEINNIVIHYVGNPNTTAQNNRDYFNKADTTVSSHFVIGLDGEIIQCLPLYERSAASNNRNGDTISIEVCHSDETGEFNDVTYKSLIKLCVYICNNLSLDENDIIRHYDITGKICPKYYVENEDAWNKFKKDLKNELNEKKE